MSTPGATGGIAGDLPDGQAPTGPRDVALRRLRELQAEQYRTELRLVEALVAVRAHRRVQEQLEAGAATMLQGPVERHRYERAVARAAAAALQVRALRQRAVALPRELRAATLAVAVARP